MNDPVPFDDGGPAYPGCANGNSPRGMSLFDAYCIGILESGFRSGDPVSTATMVFDQALAMIAEKRRRNTECGPFRKREAWNHTEAGPGCPLCHQAGEHRVDNVWYCNTDDCPVEQFRGKKTDKAEGKSL